QLASYNLSLEEFKTQHLTASVDGSLSFELEGGGNLVGINGPDSGIGPKVNMVFNNNQEYFYFEDGVVNHLDFNLINVGNQEAQDIEITAFSSQPHLDISNNKIKVEKVGQGSALNLKKQFRFKFTDYNDSSSVGNMLFEIKVNGIVSDTTTIMAFHTPKSPYVEAEDVIVLDGRSVDN